MTDGNIVWILGSGFSKSLGGPMLSELLTVEGLAGVLARWGGAFEKDLPHKVQHFYAGGAKGFGHMGAVARHWEHAEDFLERLDLASRAQENSPERAVLSAFAEELSGSPWLNKGGLTKDLFREGFERVRLTALKIMAAECCAFLANPDLKSERWQPYVRWVEIMKPNDTVITFNYDRVPELLGLDVPAPGTLFGGRNHKQVEGGLKPKKYPTKVLKLHGSVSWCMTSRGLECHGDEQALLCERSNQLGMATPGPSKREMIDGIVTIETNDNGPVNIQKPLKPLWDAATVAIRDATTIVFVGYRIPPSDAYTRKWLVEALRTNKRMNAATPAGERPFDESLPEATMWQRVENPLVIHTVLGADVNHEHSRRVQGIIDALDHQERVEADPWPMFAEDLMEVVTRERLLPSPDQKQSAER
jgi:hypothetical protein